MARTDATSLTDRERVLLLLGDARAAAWREHEARAACEDAIIQLNEYDVSARTIVDAIGTDAEGVPLMSPRTVHRIRTGEHEQNPRRRKR